MTRIWSPLRSVTRQIRFNSPHLWIFLGIAVVASVAFVALMLDWDWSNSWDWLKGEESNSAAIRNVALVVAGIIAFPLAIWRAWAAQRQADASDKSLLNERYQKGAEMLGSSTLSVRLAGIYALQRLAEESPNEYHVQITRLLCAFIRLPPYKSGGRREDVESALQAIATRTPEDLRIEQKLGFQPNLTDANLHRIKIRPRTVVEIAFYENRDRSDLENLTFVEKSSFHENLSQILLSGADLSEAWLDHTNLSGNEFEATDLSKTHFSSSDLSRSEFREARMSGALLDGATLTNAVFEQVDLTDAQLNSADLSKAMFNNSDLRGADLKNANVSKTHFSVWTIENGAWGTRMFREGRWAPGVQNLTQSQLDQAVADSDNPPILDGLIDPVTGEHLMWRGKAPEPSK